MRSGVAILRSAGKTKTSQRNAATMMMAPVIPIAYMGSKLAVDRRVVVLLPKTPIPNPAKDMHAHGRLG